MRGGFLKSKAWLMIFLIITLAFVYTNFDQVSADETSQVCCQRTTSGDSCVYTEEANCDADYLIASATCEQTTYCEVGTCVSDIGQCSDGVARGTCDDAGYQWYEGASSELDICQKDCCVIADSQASYTTESHCEYLLEDLEDVPFDFREVDSEAACLEIANSAETGCCVLEDACMFTTRGECENPEIILGEEADFSDATGFFDNTYCSNVGQCADCIAKDHMACVDEDVYWFDSCGNQEGIVEHDDIDRYGERVGNIGGENNGGGDCDYLGGSWCGVDSSGDVACQDISCVEVNSDGHATFDGEYNINLDGTFVDRNPHDSQIGEARDHGESWCLYESPAGAFKDFPGSQHYRSYCYFGEEIIEPCQDFREEVCLQVPYTDYNYQDPETGLWVSGESYSGDYDGPTGSACVDNTNNDLFYPNITTVSTGGNFWSQSYGDSTCSEANVECEQIYARDGRTDSTFQVGSGVICSSPQWALALNEYCGSFGDCGASSNIAEEYTHAGFYMSSSEEYLQRGTQIDKRVYVGYDTCVDHFISDGALTYRGNPFSETSEELTDQINDVNDGLQEAVFCLYDCLGDECAFINTIEGDDFFANYYPGDSEYYHQIVPTEEGETILMGPFPAYESYSDYSPYGVYGGLVGLSQIIDSEDLGEGVEGSLALTYAIGIVNIIGSAAYLGTATTVGLITAGASAGAAATEAATTAITLGTLGGNLGATLTNTLLIAGGIVVIVTTVAGWVDIQSTADPLERLDKSQAFAITAGIAAGVVTVSLAVAVAAGTIGPWGWVISLAAIVVAGVSAFLATGGETAEVTIQSFCEAWQAPMGGENCNLCDIPVSEGGLAIDDGEGNILRGYECTEYKCLSLGQDCQFINENVGSDREKCIAQDINDVNHPIVEAFMVDVSDEMEAQGLADTDGYISTSTSDYEFVRDDYVKILEKVEPYQTIEFGFELDELGQCRIEYDSLSDTYEEMDLYFPDSYFAKEHNQSWILTPDEVYNFYVRCQDHGGNYNIDAFVFQIETTGGDDITPPLIEATSIHNGAYVAADVTETPVSVFTNEPVEDCKWETENVEYDLMSNYMSCSGVPDSASSLFENECTGVLNVSLGSNDYYFACRDGSDNINTENYAFSLVGTEPLYINATAPNGTIYFDYTDLYVETSIGAEDGKSVCYYDGIEFLNTNASTHSQPLEDLAPGDYFYDVSCVDAGGNSAESEISFTIDVDTSGPTLTSLYIDGDTVHYGFDEEVECEFFYEEFVFGEGTSTSGSFTITDLDTYYLTCQDIFGNEESIVIEV